MTDWAKLKVVDLKAELKQRGLPQNGLKIELVNRLNASDAETPTLEVQTAAEPSASEEPASLAEEVNAQVDTDSKPAEDVQVVEQEPTPPPPTETRATSSQEQLPIEEPVRTPANEADAQEAAEATTRQESPKVESSEIIQDAQKRKRRSSTPPPSVKRVRPDDETEVSNGSLPPPTALPIHQNGVTVFVTDQVTAEKEESAVSEPTRNVVEENSDRIPSRQASSDRDMAITGEEAYRARLALSESRDLGPRTFRDARVFSDPSMNEPLSQPHYPQDAEDKMIEPSIHPATTSLYIKNFMRPLRAPMVQDYLVELATPPGKSPDPNIVIEFYLDQVRTHAFVRFETEASASRVRSALHDQVWPDERNRKALWVDFIPPERVSEWTEEEQTAGRGNFARWEVMYDQDQDGVIARLEEVGLEARSRAPAGPVAPKQAPAQAGSDRVYPGIEAAPRGPRNPGGPRPGPGLLTRLDPNSLRTQSSPPLSYQPVSEELARRRMDKMYSFVSKHAGENVGGELNRYTFENHDSFVDRGKEVFVGIRPPHRERERRQRDRRDRAGGGPGRREGPPAFPRGDRYFGGRDDYRAPPSRPNEDRFGRNKDDRRPRYRDFRDERAPRGSYGEPYRSRR